MMKSMKQQVEEFVAAWGISNEEQPMTTPRYFIGLDKD